LKVSNQRIGLITSYAVFKRAYFFFPFILMHTAVGINVFSYDADDESHIIFFPFVKHQENSSMTNHYN